MDKMDKKPINHMATVAISQTQKRNIFPHKPEITNGTPRRSTFFGHALLAPEGEGAGGGKAVGRDMAPVAGGSGRLRGTLTRWQGERQRGDS